MKGPSDNHWTKIVRINTDWREITKSIVENYNARYPDLTVRYYYCKITIVFNIQTSEFISEVKEALSEELREAFSDFKVEKDINISILNDRIIIKPNAVSTDKLVAMAIKNSMQSHKGKVIDFVT